MSRGDGRTFKPKNSSNIALAYYRAGIEIRESTGLSAADPKNWKVAAKMLRDRVHEVREEQRGGESFVGPAQQRITVDELFDSLQSDYELRRKWNDRVESTVKKVREHFGGWRAVSVTSEAVAAFQLRLRGDGYADATINRFCQVLGQAFNLAVENKRLTRGPVVKHLSEKGNERRGFFTEAEMRSVITGLPAHLQDFVLFAYISGMRRGEVRSLRWSDVDVDTITLQAADSKNGEGRTIALEGELAELIERRQQARRTEKKGFVTISDYVFHDGGTPIGEFRKSWATACVAAGVGSLLCPECEGNVDAKHHCEKCKRDWKREDLRYRGRIFHDLRRCAARNLLHAGVAQATAMTITGHKTDSMFRRYAIVTVEQQREALRAAAIYRQKQAERSKVVRIN